MLRIQKHQKISFAFDVFQLSVVLVIIILISTLIINYTATEQLINFADTIFLSLELPTLIALSLVIFTGLISRDLVQSMVSKE